LRPNVGEASLYGIYYDDTEYDYMQHLRSVGVQEEGVESILMDVTPAKPKGKGKATIALKDLPAEALPSGSELPRDYESQEAIPSSIAGFQPDLNPHLRQTLEALEDDAFVDEGLDDDFFGNLIGEGELEEGEDIEFEFEEDGVEDNLPNQEHPDENEQDQSFEARFARFKKEQKRQLEPGPLSDIGDASETGDTIGELPPLLVIGGKRRRKGASDATGYSMSSSSMTRNDALQTLDEQFDVVRLHIHTFT
jgi:protein LTV1